MRLAFNLLSACVEFFTKLKNYTVNFSENIRLKQSFSIKYLLKFCEILSNFAKPFKVFIGRREVALRAAKMAAHMY